jgi:hypothetical protein
MANYRNFAIFAKIDLGGNFWKVWKVPSIILRELKNVILKNVSSDNYFGTFRGFEIVEKAWGDFERE